jgi:hypothetical protein
MRLPLVGIEDGSVCRQEKTFPMKGWLVGLTPPPVGRRSEGQAKAGQKKLDTARPSHGSRDRKEAVLQWPFSATSRHLP